MFNKRIETTMPNKNNKKKQNGQIGRLVQVQGQGNYYTDKVVPIMQQVVPAGTFRKAGAMAGGLVGRKYGPNASKAGTIGGGFLGGQLSRVLGFGDYEVRNNTISTKGFSVPEGLEVPTFKREGRMTNITHREFVCDIVVPGSPTSFNNTSYSINAANSALFPWLASVASNFQQYRFNGLMFEYKTLSSDITAGGALGSVILATDYDVNSIKFPNKIVMENSEFAVSAKPSHSQLHAVECDPRETAHPILYCRDSSRDISSTSDNRLYDHGNFQLATSGLPGSAGAILGELWVTYDVTLMKPEIATPFAGSFRAVCSTGVTKNLVFGTAPSVAGNLVSLDSNTVTFGTIGTYFGYLAVKGTTMVLPTVSGTAITTTLVAPFPYAATLTDTNVMYKFEVTALNRTVVFDLSASAAITSSEFAIVSCDGTNIA